MANLFSSLRRFDLFSLNVFRPNFFRQTPFRLTLVFLAVYIFVAALVFGFVYIATAGESKAFGDVSVSERINALKELDSDEGDAQVVARLLNDEASEWGFAKGAFDGTGQVLGQNQRAKMEPQPLTDAFVHAGLNRTKADGDVVPLNVDNTSPKGRARFQGRVVRINEDFYIYVAMDMTPADRGFHREIQAVLGGGILVVILGLFAGTLVNQEVSRSVARVNAVLTQVQEGDLKARIPVRDSGDEIDMLSRRINDTLERMEKTMGNLKYAGDAIAHDLRSPLSRLRSKLEVSLLDVDKDPSNAKSLAHDALARALDETDQLLRTFQTVFAISRLQAAGQAPDQQMFSATDLATDMAELFEAVAADKGIEFEAEIAPNVRVFGNRDFLAQALANLLDNAIKYTPQGGVTFRLRRTSQREIEFSITDTGPGVPEDSRGRIKERFVRLENSRTLPGVGLGLSMVDAVAVAHRGRLTIDEGPGVYGTQGPGLRTALVLPPAAG